MTKPHVTAGGEIYMHNITSDIKLEQFNPFITKICFYNYKNLEYGSTINFTHPITAIVGPNGTNKSSILQALYGCPSGKSIGDYWFNTAIDPIEDVELDENRPRVIYYYCREDNNDTATTCPCVNLYRAPRKESATKKNDPDYWETGRARKKYNMNLPKDRQRRWPPIKKSVIYLDFRNILSAYDIMFHHGIYNKSKTINSVQDFIRARSKHLRNALLSGKEVYHKKMKLLANEFIASRELKIISYILGRNYEEAQIIRHTFFRDKEATTVIFKNNNQYSEAYAGSGEFAVVQLVLSISKIDHHSLILLDEPETSLHPEAQRKLVKYLLEESINKHHQIVISTHSPTIIQELDKSSIKLVDIDNRTPKVYITENVAPQVAFHALGQKTDNKWTVIVEDELAAEIVKRAIQPDTTLRDSVTIKPIPGGAETILTRYIPAIMMLDDPKTIIYLDGDKFHVQPKASGTIPQSDDDKLAEIIKKTVGCEVKFYVDGNRHMSETAQDRHERQRHEQERAFLNFIYKFLRFLPVKGKTPEDWLLSISGEETSDMSGKDFFKKKACDAQFTETPKSDEIFLEEQLFIRQLDPQNQGDLVQIRETIKSIVY